MVDWRELREATRETPEGLLASAKSVVASATQCQDHPCTAPEEKDWDAVVSARQWCSCEESGGSHCGGCCDSAGAALVRLKDGSFFVACESSDTSGHG